MKHYFNELIQFQALGYQATVTVPVHTFICKYMLYQRTPR